VKTDVEHDLKYQTVSDERRQQCLRVDALDVVHWTTASLQ